MIGGVRSSGGFSLPPSLVLHFFFCWITNTIVQPQFSSLSETRVLTITRETTSMANDLCCILPPKALGAKLISSVSRCFLLSSSSTFAPSTRRLNPVQSSSRLVTRTCRQRSRPLLSPGSWQNAARSDDSMLAWAGVSGPLLAADADPVCQFGGSVLANDKRAALRSASLR